MPQSHYAESLHERGRMAKLRNSRSFLLAGTRIKKNVWTQFFLENSATLVRQVRS